MPAACVHGCVFPNSLSHSQAGAQKVAKIGCIALPRGVPASSIKGRLQKRAAAAPVRALCLDADSKDQSRSRGSVEDEDLTSPSLSVRRAGLEERYAVLNSGVSECRSCGYTYDQRSGDAVYPVAAGTSFQDLPENWRCPTCGAARSYFSSKGIEVAGFAQNQNYGLGANSLTSGQKSVLIYGSLLFFFALFLAGYWLQ